MNLFVLFLYIFFIVYRCFKTSSLDTWEIKKEFLKGARKTYPIYCFKTDNVLAKAIHNSGHWTDQNRLKAILKQAFNISNLKCMDIGANIGVMTLQMIDSKCAHVTAIEAAFGNILNSTIYENNLQNRVKIFKNAVSSKKEILKINLSKSNPGASSQICKSSEYIYVNAEKLEYFISDDIYDFVKIDIEGHEKQIYPELLKLMLNEKIKSALVEVHKWDEETVKFLKNFTSSDLRIVDAKSLKNILTNLNSIQKYNQIFIYKPTRDILLKD